MALEVALVGVWWRRWRWWRWHGLLSGEKITMQRDLEHLASCLEKVLACAGGGQRSLEVKIRDWHLKQTPTSRRRDYSPYFKTIDELRRR